MEPRYDDPWYNDIPGITINIPRKSYTKMFGTEPQYRARNNFRIVSGHEDRPNSFLLGHVSFLAGQMYDELLF